jgi:hypothetical protein
MPHELYVSELTRTDQQELPEKKWEVISSEIVRVGQEGVKGKVEVQDAEGHIEKRFIKGVTPQEKVDIQQKWEMLKARGIPTFELLDWVTDQANNLPLMLTEDKTADGSIVITINNPQLLMSPEFAAFRKGLPIEHLRIIARQLEDILEKLCQIDSEGRFLFAFDTSYFFIADPQHIRAPRVEIEDIGKDLIVGDANAMSAVKSPEEIKEFMYKNNGEHMHSAFERIFSAKMNYLET